MSLYDMTTASLVCCIQILDVACERTRQGTAAHYRLADMRAIYQCELIERYAQ